MSYNVGGPSAGGGGGEVRILAQWNGIDTSQFQVAFDGIAGGAAALSVVQAAWGPVLRLTFPTKLTGEQYCAVTWVDPGIVKDANNLYRYTSKMRIVGFSGVSAEWYCIGQGFLCNKLTGANFYGLCMGAAGGTASRMTRIQAGVGAASGSTPNWVASQLVPTNSGIQVHHRNAVVAKHAAAAPGFSNTTYARRLNDGSTITVPDGVTSTIFASSIGAFGAGWATQTLDTCGIMILSANGTTANQYMDFDCLEVLTGTEF